MTILYYSFVYMDYCNSLGGQILHAARQSCLLDFSSGGVEGELYLKVGGL